MQNIAHRAKKELFGHESAISCENVDEFVPLYKAILRIHLEYCFHGWVPFLKEDATCLGKVPWLATIWLTVAKVRHEEMLHALDFSSVREGLRAGGLIETFRILEGLMNANAKDFLGGQLIKEQEKIF